MDFAPRCAYPGARRFRWALPILWLFVLITQGCDGPTNRERAELAQISRAIDQVRDASNSSKNAFLPDLAQAPCTSECGLRDLCRDAYALHVSALRLIDEVKVRAEPGIASQAKLSESVRLLDEARPKIEACTTMQADRKRALGL